jgi:alpha-1,3-rhamnosyl/mannosyltransferase
LPEVGGDAVVYVKSNQPEQIRSSLMQVLNDDQLCQNLTIKGLEQAKLFNWERTAHQTIEAYRRIT